MCLMFCSMLTVLHFTSCNQATALIHVFVHPIWPEHVEQQAIADVEYLQVTPVARESSGIGGKQGKSDVVSMFPDAECAFTDVTDTSAITKDVFDTPKDVVVCCLASRTGGIKDSWDIDYQVNLL